MNELSEKVGKLLLSQGKTVASAESCTGGLIAHKITAVAGSSAYYKGSVVSYCNEIKEKVLGVSHSNLVLYGAVSQQVVEQMAEGVRMLMDVDYAVSTSGVAGPGGGTEQKPVGTVWVALATPDGVRSQCCHFGTNRATNIEASAETALQMLYDYLTQI